MYVALRWPPYRVTARWILDPNYREEDLADLRTQIFQSIIEACDELGFKVVLTRGGSYGSILPLHGDR